MAALKSDRLVLSEFLLNADLVDELRERFALIRGAITTTIHEAADLTGLSEAQLRYAESRGLLAPNRALNTNPDDTPIRGQRRYTVENLLRARLISFILDHGYSLSDIVGFMSANSSFIQELLETSTVRLKPVLENTDSVLFHRYFIPRALYYALSLIFERNAMADAGIVFPIRSSYEELAALDVDSLRTADDLYRLGHMFVAWRARGRPLTTFITSGNPFEREQYVMLHPFADLAKGVGGADMPTHVFIAYEQQVERELEQANRTFQLAQARDASGYTGIGHRANPRAVAGRLLRYIQNQCCSGSAATALTDTSASGTLLYNAPEMMDPLLGDTLLNCLANTIVDLGGPSTQPASEETRPGEHDAAPGQQAKELGKELDTTPGKALGSATNRWRFACVLTPRDPNALFTQQELVVRAQSAFGPHRIGVTTTSSKFNGGLTWRAYSSGFVVYRPNITSHDPTISYVGEESPIRSAIAAPVIEGQAQGHGQPPAILYITSEEDYAFGADDYLMIRVMGQVIGELVQTYNSRGNQPNTLTDTLADPEVVDTYFAGFMSDSSFVHDLTQILTNAFWKSGGATTDKPVAADPYYDDVQSLTLICLDVNGFTSIQQRQGDRVARMIAREIGKRIQQRMKVSFSQGFRTARLYRAWGDRFYLLVRDEDVHDARRSAENIRESVSNVYRLDGNIVLPQRHLETLGSGPQPGGIQVVLRMAGASLTVAELIERIAEAENSIPSSAVGLIRLLEDGVEQANEATDASRRSLWWSVKGKRFEPTV